MRVGDTQKHLMIASWGGLLDSMAARTRDYAEAGIETEIRQLRSLAKYADERSVQANPPGRGIRRGFGNAETPVQAAC